MPIRLCFINIYTYPNPKQNNAKTVIIVVQRDKNTLYWCEHAQLYPNHKSDGSVDELWWT